MVKQSKQKVAYFYDSDFQTFYFGRNHPMKPQRLSMCHQLVLGYGLHEHMEVYRPHRAHPSEMAQFHDPSFIQFLCRITPENQAAFHSLCNKFNIDGDCPIFDGLFKFCQLYVGASLEGAHKLNHGLCDIAINWAGGLHHAKKDHASGFCYVNDLVLAILELLKHHARVLYIDIDIHHGDGVEEAFYLSDRVMTVSFHRYGPWGMDYFFPGTGSLDDTGELKGKHYSVNVPLKDGTTDETFHFLFKPILRRVMEVFQPGAIVMQCGADSLASDRIGCFNMSLKGHGEAVRFMKEYNIPMLVTGGGGYTKSNVARCWTYETSILVGQPVAEHLPVTEYHEYFQPDFSLNVDKRKSMEDWNTKTAHELENMRNKILEQLRRLAHTPSVQMKYAPPSVGTNRFQLEEGDGFEERLGKYAKLHNVILPEDPA